MEQALCEMIIDQHEIDGEFSCELDANHEGLCHWHGGSLDVWGTGYPVQTSRWPCLNGTLVLTVHGRSGAWLTFTGHRNPQGEVLDLIGLGLSGEVQAALARALKPAAKHCEAKGALCND